MLKKSSFCFRPQFRDVKQETPMMPTTASSVPTIDASQLRALSEMFNFTKKVLLMKENFNRMSKEQAQGAEAIVRHMEQRSVIQTLY